MTSNLVRRFRALEKVWRSKAARYFAYGAAGAIAAVVAAALIIPAFLDLSALEAQIQRKLSEAVHGEVAWDALQVRLLPSPRGSLRGLRLDVPGLASVRVDEADTRLRLLPLFRGRAEITSISVRRPDIRIEIAARGPAKAGKEAAADPMLGYRSAMGTVLDAIRKFAPDTLLEIDEGIVNIGAPDLPPIRLSGLALRARSDSTGMDLEASTASNYWSRLKLSARIELADLSAVASLDTADIKLQEWLDRYLPKSPVGVAVPAASLRAQFRTDGKTSFDGRLDASAAIVEFLSAGKRVRLESVAIKGEATAGVDEIQIRMSDTQLGASKLSRGSLRYSQKSGEASGSVAFELDLPQVMDAVRRLLPEENRDALEVIQSVAGVARGDSRFAFGRKDWSAVIDIQKSDASVQMRNLPGPVNLAGASVTVGPNAVKLDRAALSMLDADAIASATIAYGKELRVEGTVSEGKAGEKFLAWVWQIAGLPPHLALKTPIRVAARRIAWSPKPGLDVDATAAFEAGPAVSIDLNWMPEALDIRRAALKDARSDAAIALRTKGRAVEGSVSGSLSSASIESMLKSAKLPSGSASGNLLIAFDRDHPGRGSAKGNLKGENIDLAWLLRRPVKIERIDLAADGASLRVREASVNWAGQRAALRGEVKRGAGGGVIDAQIDSPGIVVDALLPPRDEPPGEAPPAAAAPPGDWDSRLWPLPVTGRIAVRSDFIKYGARDIAPFAATLALEAQRARLDLTQARLCGISMPLTLEATPKGLSGTIQLSAQKQQLERAVHCLSNEGVLITGEFDLKADLSTRGKARELARNLEGTVSTEVRNGKVRKFALLGNILSLKSVSDLFEKDKPKLEDAGFPYRRIALNGHFQGGRFIVEESAFHSTAVGLAATGWISVVDFQSRLAVLVAPFSRLDQIVRNVPIVGYVLGGTLTSVPVGVSGDIRDPLIVPLGPEAITSELTGIFTRALKLPANILAPLKPAAAPQPQPP